MTLSDLIRAYCTDTDSPYCALRYASRMTCNSRLKLLDLAYGTVALADINARMLLAWHRLWSANGKVTSAHGKIGQLRTLFSFGATILEDADCRRLKEIAAGLRFQMGKSRTERLTEAQVSAVIAKAHKMGEHAIARAMAFQFECTFRQKDIIGEWVPLTEPGISDVIDGGFKWLRGLRWEEIDGDLILRHMTSKRQKPVEIDLKLAPMVMSIFSTIQDGKENRHGPIILAPDGLPYTARAFRKAWRAVATAAGVPATTFNMDSRSGAISEALGLGARMVDVQAVATHSDQAMTQKYCRIDREASDRVMELRAGSRRT